MIASKRAPEKRQRIIKHEKQIASGDVIFFVCLLTPPDKQPSRQRQCAIGFDWRLVFWLFLSVRLLAYAAHRVAIGIRHASAPISYGADDSYWGAVGLRCALHG